MLEFARIYIYNECRKMGVKMVGEWFFMYKGLTKIKTNEEYEEKKQELKYYVDEYSWITKSQNPLKDMKEKIGKLLDGYNAEDVKEQQLEALRAIHRLQVKYASVRKGEYPAVLKRNITATLIQIEQYEASIEKYPAFQMLKGVITGNQDIKNHLRRKHLLSKANDVRVAPGAIDLNTESIEDILEYIDKNYNLVDIKIPKEELSLMPVEVENDITHPLAEKIQEMTKTFLEEQISNEKEELSTIDNTSKATVDILSPKLSKTQKKERTKDEEVNREWQW